jgi:hypothetical protein
MFMTACGLALAKHAASFAAGWQFGETSRYVGIKQAYYIFQDNLSVLIFGYLFIKEKVRKIAY